MGSTPAATCRALETQEMPMKVLTDDEVVAIAGGLPPVAALDEVFYRSAPEPLRDPIAFAELAAEERPAAPAD